MKPPCSALGIHFQFCRYFVEEDLLDVIKQQGTSPVWNDKTNTSEPILPTFLESVLSHLHAKIHSRKKPNDVCSSCVPYQNLTDHLPTDLQQHKISIALTGLWQHLLQTGRATFVFTAEISMPALLSPVGYKKTGAATTQQDRVIKILGNADPQRKYLEKIDKDSPQKGIFLEFATSKVQSITRTSLYAPDQRACGAEAATACGIDKSDMRYCACRASPTILQD